VVGGGQQRAAHQGLRAQPTGFSIEAAFSEAIRTARQQKSASLLKRAKASYADCGRWAVLRSNWPAHTSLWSFLSSASLTCEFQGDVLVDWGHRLRIEFDPPNDSGIK
jgi:hypothetical protein